MANSTTQRLHIAAFFGMLLLIGTSDIDGREPLRMQVSPTMALAPARLTVRVTVEADADNRYLEVVAESSDFYRSSQVQLDGSGAGPLQVFEFRNLPTGLYQITGVLIGEHGLRGTVTRMAKVQPSPGSGDR